MKRLLSSAALVFLFLVVCGKMTFATATLELVVGGDTLYVTDGAAGSILCTAGTCSSYAASGDNDPSTGGVNIVAGDATHSFDGWKIKASGTSNSPSCPANDVCLSDINIDAFSTGAGTLTVYFGDTDFDTVTNLTATFTGSHIPTGGTATQTAYATTIFPLASGADPSPFLTPAMQIGVPVPVIASGGSGFTNGPGQTGPFNLILKTVFTANATGGSFTTDGSVTTVPEPAAVVLFGTVLALCATSLRRKRNCP